ncbi:MAG: carboxymuconolactone decarboxylase family protein [Candidatus Latescibacterota bacterium]
MSRPFYLDAVARHDPSFLPLLESEREFVMRDGAIPAKYKMLMTLVCDALLGHDKGCEAIANRARAAGATEEEIAEAVRIAQHFGGVPALVSALMAYPKEG